MAIMCVALACVEHSRDAPTSTEPAHPRLHGARCSSLYLMALMGVACACLKHLHYALTYDDASHVRLHDERSSCLGSVCGHVVFGYGPGLFHRRIIRVAARARTVAPPLRGLPAHLAETIGTKDVTYASSTSRPCMCAPAGRMQVWRRWLWRPSHTRLHGAHCSSPYLMVLMGKAGKKPTSRDDASHAHLYCTCSSSPHLMAIMCAVLACAEHSRDAPTSTEPSHARLHGARCSSPCLMALMSIAFACLEHLHYVPTRDDASHV